jgi:hypothetical protein
MERGTTKAGRKLSTVLFKETSDSKINLPTKLPTKVERRVIFLPP